MKTIFKRLTALVLTLIFVSCLIPVSVFADYSSSYRIKDLRTSYINPVYKSYAMSNTLPSFWGDTPESDSYPVFDDTEDAGEYMRDLLKERNTYIVFKFRIPADDYQDEFVEAMYDIIDEAWEHTGIGNEGDYIKWQTIRWGVSGQNGVFVNNLKEIQYDVAFSFEFFTNTAQEAAMDEFANDFVEKYYGLSNNYQKICAIYDCICDNVTYDYSNASSSLYYLKHSAYAAAINETAVCQGYALLFYRLALELGIDCRFIGGYSDTAHAWNIVKLGDVYYNVDATWDAGAKNYEWFLLGSKNFISHTRYSEFNTTSYNRAHPVSKTDFDLDDYVLPPKLTSSSDSDSGKPKLSWNKVDDAESYQLYRSSSGEEGTFSLIKTTTGTSYTDSKAVTGNSYYYKLRAVYDDSKGEFGNVVKITAKCATPTMSLDIDTDSGKPVISWTAVEDASYYKVAYCTTKDGEYKLLCDTTSTSATHTKAVAGKQYYYKVRAIHSNSSANGIYCSPKYVICDLAQPTMTLSLDSASGKPVISWEGLTGASYYKVAYCTTKDGEYKLLCDTTSTSTKHSKAVAGQQYYYKVRAIHSNSSANGTYCSPKYVTCDLAQPVVTASNIASTGKVRLNWNAIDGAEKYILYRSETGETGSWTAVNMSGTSVTHSSAVAGTTYYYKVRAIHSNSAANSAYSTIVSCTCDLPQPTVSIALNSNNKPKISWNAIEGAKNYTLYHSTTGETGSWTSASTTGTSITHSSAKSGTKYYYKVRANHTTSAANSAYSDTVTITAG